MEHRASRNYRCEHEQVVTRDGKRELKGALTLKKGANGYSKL